MVSISAGHWDYPNSGASDLINEVKEARRVVNKVVSLLRSGGVSVNKIEDNSSRGKQANLSYLVKSHNKSSRTLDVSVHFNASAGRVKGDIGVEVLYLTEVNLAKSLSRGISAVSGLKDRGAKKRSDLAILKGTDKPCVLIEVCFVNSEADVAKYNAKFDEICQEIATQLAKYVGKTLVNEPKKPAEGGKNMCKNCVILSDTARKDAKILIEKACVEGVFSPVHLEIEGGKRKLDAYTDSQLVSYVISYVSRVS